MEPKEVKKQWSLRSSGVSESTVDMIINKYGLSRTCAELVSARCGSSEREIDAFINRDFCPQRDPRTLNDMDKAVQRILRAVKNKDDVIAVYGDYDVDGVTSVSMMYLYLTSLGLRVGYYIPSRNDEGYGVNKNAINKLYEITDLNVTNFFQKALYDWITAKNKDIKYYIYLIRDNCDRKQCGSGKTKNRTFIATFQQNRNNQNTGDGNNCKT